MEHGYVSHTQAVAIMGFMAGPVLPPLTALRWMSARIPVAITGLWAGRPIYSTRQNKKKGEAEASRENGKKAGKGTG